MADHIVSPKDAAKINSIVTMLKSISNVNFEITYMETDGLGRTFLCKYKNSKFSRFQIK